MRVKLNGHEGILHRPHGGNTLGRQDVQHLREYLAHARVTPSLYEAGKNSDEAAGRRSRGDRSLERPRRRAGAHRTALAALSASIAKETTMAAPATSQCSSAACARNRSTGRWRMRSSASRRAELSLEIVEIGDLPLYNQDHEAESARRS